MENSGPRAQTEGEGRVERKRTEAARKAVWEKESEDAESLGVPLLKSGNSVCPGTHPSLFQSA